MTGDDAATEFPPTIGTVARRELAASGLTRYLYLADLSVDEVLAIHGVGPKAVRILRAELKRRGLDFRGSPMP